MESAPAQRGRASSMRLSGSAARTALSGKDSAQGKNASVYFTLMLENMPPFFSTEAGEPDTEICPMPLTVALTVSLA